LIAATNFGQEGVAFHCLTEVNNRQFKCDEIADEEGDDLFIQIIETNWGSITKSSKSNKFAKWCVDKFGPDFKGDFHDGLPKKGVLTFRDGRSLEGEFIEGGLSGKGIERKDNKILFKGEFSEGSYDGKGMLKLNPNMHSKGKYHGQFKAGKMHGHGKVTGANGGVFEGNYKDGKKQGHGKFTWSNSSSFVGTYKDDERYHGTIFHEGQSYDGVIQTVRNGDQAARLSVSMGSNRVVVFEYSDGIIRLID